MTDSDAASTPPLPPPVSPWRKKAWFAIVLIAVVAFIAATAWYCSFVTIAPQPSCVSKSPVADPQTGEVSGTVCEDTVVQAYRCEPLVLRLRSLF